MNNEVTGAEPVSQPAGQNGPSEYINLSGELVLDPERVVEANAEMVANDTPADGDSIGGVDFILEVNKNPVWIKRVRILLNTKPADMSQEDWQKAVNLVVRQEETINP